MLIHSYFQSPEYAELSARAVRALIDLYCQYRGRNNGDLTAAWSVMSKVGWTSKSQLSKAVEELLQKGWLIITRRGHKRREPTLYGLTFMGIDECGGKVNEMRPNPVPLQLWRRDRRGIVVMLRRSGRLIRTNSVALHTGQSSPPHGLMIEEKHAI